VQSALSKIGGVEKAEVELPNKASIKYDPKKTNPKELIAAVKKAGYTAVVKGEEEKKQ
jgi:copper chaperone CopZ